MGNKADVVKGLAKRCNENWSVAPKSDIVRIYPRSFISIIDFSLNRASICLIYRYSRDRKLIDVSLTTCMLGSLNYDDTKLESLRENPISFAF